MSESGSTMEPMGQQGQRFADKADVAVQDGIGATEKKAGQALDKMSSGIAEVRDQATPVLDKISDQAQKVLQQGREIFDDTSNMLRERASSASETVTGYTKDEPIKALLVAAATGALLMGLISLMARSDD